MGVSGDLITEIHSRGDFNLWVSSNLLKLL